MNKGPRVDDVVVDLGGLECNTPAKIICFLAAPGVTVVPLDELMDAPEEDPLNAVFVLVQYYQVKTWKHPVMQRPRCILSDAKVSDNYHLISMRSIIGHAHLIPDFDDGSGKHFFWDVVDANLLVKH